MATIALQTPLCITKNPPIEWMEVKAAETFAEGMFVKKDTGEVATCADGDTGVYGQAMKAASGYAGTTTKIPVIRALPGVRWEMNVHHDTPASAVTAVTQRDVQYNLGVVSGVCYCDIENNTAKLMQVVGFSEKDAIGDVNGRVIVEFLPDVSESWPQEKTP